MNACCIARVDLGRRTVAVEAMSKALFRQCLGGKALGLRLLEGDTLVFATGPLTAAGKYCVLTRSPETGLPMTATPGGVWGARLRNAGFAALVITGQAQDWTSLRIADGTIRFQEREPDCPEEQTSVLTLGIAGEKQVPIAAVLNDGYRAVGRAGFARAMASKKLKGISVQAPAPLSRGCAVCPVPCGPRRPSAFSRQCGADSRTDGECSQLCDELGLDAVAAAKAIGAAMELHRQGALPEWDEEPSLQQRLREIARAETAAGILLGMGAGAVYAHCGLTMPRQESPKRKAAVCPALANVIDSLGCCLFTARKLTIADYTRMLNEAEGTDFTPEELLEIGKNCSAEELPPQDSFRG